MIDITNLSAFKLTAFANEILEIQKITDLDKFFLNTEKIPPFKILGAGSNTVFLQDFSGTILLNKIRGIEKESEDINSVVFAVGGGEIWDDFVHFAVENNLGGVENLIAIPGTVGASPVQNIGAYGSEVKDTIEWVEIYEIATGKIQKMSNLECQFNYRDSIFKNELMGKVFITRVGFKLNKNPVANLTFNAVAEIFKDAETIPTIQQVCQKIQEIRTEKLPNTQTHPNCGSFFKNPVVPLTILENLKHKYPQIPFFLIDNENVKIPAAWLIDNAGLKNFKMGNLGTHPLQPLVLVNYGQNTKGEELLTFVKYIQDKIYTEFGIFLEPEVNFF